MFRSESSRTEHPPLPTPAAHRLRRHSLALAVAVLASVLVVQVQAAADTPCGPNVPTCTPPTIPDPTDLTDPNQVNEPLVVLDIPGVLSVINVVDQAGDPVGVGTDVATLPATSTPVDPKTDVEGDPANVQSPGYVIDPANRGSSGYTCVNNRSNRYFKIGSPVATSGDEHRAQYHWQWNPYTQYYARQVSGRWMWQEEICAVGGADGQNGHHVVYQSSIMATKSTNTARRQGLDYGENSKGSNNGASLTLGFAAGPVTISGTFPFGGDGSLYGGYGRPQYQSSADQWYQTESNAGWKDCTHWRWCGSSDFQSQVHQGLFEFFHGDWNKTFPIDAQYATICSHPYGINC